MSDHHLDPMQARARFGELVHAKTRTHREFDDPDGGIWRPDILDGALMAYKLYPEPRTVKAMRWRTRR